MDVVPGRHWGRATVYVLLYLGFVALGVRLLWVPLETVRSQAGLLYALWAWLLISGGLLSIMGTLTGIWLAELLAQVLLATPFAVWAWALAQLPNPGRWPYALVCYIIIVCSAIRAIDLWWLAKRSRDTA